MALIKETKQAIISEYKIHDTDTGSQSSNCNVNGKVNQLTEHLKWHRKIILRRGLLKMVGKTCPAELLKGDLDRYKNLIEKLS